MIEVIKISELNMNAGTQQRVLNHDTVERYAGLLTDGTEFPAVGVVRDGESLILWDGFHRVNAHVAADRDKIEAEITIGTRRDALWLSLGANKDNGLPNDKTALKRKLRIVFEDNEWAGKSLRDIAGHVGCSHEWVKQVRKQIEQEKQEAESLKGEKKIASPSGLELRDAVGNVIPAEYEEVFNVRGEVDKVISALKKAGCDVVVLKEKEGSDYINDDNVGKNIGQITKYLEAAKPYAMCPICGGFNKDNCEACDGDGWTIQKQYENAVKMLGGAE